MLKLITRRILAAIPILFGTVSLIFFVARILPGDPAAMFLSPKIPASALESARRDFGLDQPLLNQYGQWLSGLARGDLGYSFVAHQSVVNLVNEAFSNTLLLGLTALLLQLVLGLGLGLLAALKPHSFFDRALSSGGLVLYSLPTFWVGTLLLSLFAYQLELFPPSQMHMIGASALSPFSYALDVLKHLFLPAMTIALPASAGLGRYFRINLEHTLNQQYVSAAQSYGLTRPTILIRYALPNALMPIITLGGIEIGKLLSGALVTETLFAWPGMGRLIVTAVLARDYPLIVGCAVLSGVVVIVGNLIADVLHILVDPRVSMEQ